MDLELIGFPLCPYAQRTLITLRHKRVDFKLTWISPASRPDWFADVSPLGKVPVLRVDGRRSIFESAVINELIDELHPPALLPADPFERAWERGWIAHVSTLLGALHKVGGAEDEAAFVGACDKLFAELEPMERQLTPCPLFRGDDLSLLDAAMAPFFMRLELVDSLRPVGRWREHTRLAGWSRALGALPVVESSVTPSFRDDFFASLGARGGLVAREL